MFDFLDMLSQYQTGFSQNAMRQRIAALKRKLAKTDYKAIKYAEGWISAEDYAPIKAERQAIRDQINDLEAELEARIVSATPATEPAAHETQD